MSHEYIAQLVSETVEVVVQIARLPDGKRQVTAIAEVVGCQDSLVVSQDLWRRDKPAAPLRWSGIRPDRLLDKFDAAGLAYELPLGGVSA
jgi:hypothetical protein